MTKEAVMPQTALCERIRLAPIVLAQVELARKRGESDEQKGVQLRNDSIPIDDGS